MDTTLALTVLYGASAILGGGIVWLITRWTRTRFAVDSARATVLYLADTLESAPPQFLPCNGLDQLDDDQQEALAEIAQQGWVYACRAMRAAATPGINVPDHLPDNFGATP